MDNKEFESIFKKANVCLNDNGTIDYDIIICMVENYLYDKDVKRYDKLTVAEYDVTIKNKKGGV